ncbi:hypothetical protein B0H10DRAFT_2054194 [Mycena sp. CBHHK59/15]|nr:hypothetical protein B0H10DRAFT_2054194 [Mycena sp. CBHHK59/15]
MWRTAYDRLAHFGQVALAMEVVCAVARARPSPVKGLRPGRFVWRGGKITRSRLGEGPEGWEPHGAVVRSVDDIRGDDAERL